MQEILIKIKNEVQNKYNFTPSNNIQLLVENLQKLKSKEGCYVELGTFRGSTLLSVAIATKLLNIDTELFGVDTFEGFPNTTINNLILFSKPAKSSGIKDFICEYSLSQINSDKTFASEINLLNLTLPFALI